MTDRNPDHVYIREAAELLNRRMGTLRKWEQQGVLPKHLRSHRGERNWRYWTRAQIEGIKEWIRDTQRYSGCALPSYNPTVKELEKAIEAMRRPHSPTRRLRETA
jgi:DNA-binding transcriptional MerR regulator